MAGIGGDVEAALEKVGGTDSAIDGWVEVGVKLGSREIRLKGGGRTGESGCRMRVSG